MQVTSPILSDSSMARQSNEVLMKSASLRLAAVLFALGMPSFVSAASIVSVTFSGPGGSGTASTIPQFFPTTSYQSVVFHSIDYIDITFTVDAAATYHIHQYPFTVLSKTYGDYIQNQTGLDWQGFQIFNLSPQTSSITRVGTLLSLPNVTFDSSSATLMGSPVVSNNGEFGLYYDVTTNAPGTFTFREIPIAVPESSTLALVGESLLLGGGTWFFRRRLAR